MKKIVFISTVVFVLITGLACTNKEGDSDLDIITPQDSTQTENFHKRFPKHG